ncbi:helix-turn-helix transcriptional regulator [Clostridium sp. 'deep sea']|uniref:helix-turn-helix domain-containing protein n=1 Tax=Clostridium sp. 'deep sea' TaxID=2779445 RepID=UPI001A9B58A8|nr:helix-turn-helix transcriptional regulator [Clostridium sp. 'deep sea']
MINISQKLKQLRKQHKISQENLAELLGISRQVVSKWENGLSKPETNNLLKIAKIFNISVEELVSSDVIKAETLQQESIKFKIPMLVVISYLTSFASILGFFCIPVSNVQHPKTLWIAVAFIGGCLLLIKNTLVQDENKTIKVILSDMLIIIFACILGVLIPNTLGLAKQLIIVSPLAIYYAYITRKFFLQPK